MSVTNRWNLVAYQWWAPVYDLIFDHLFFARARRRSLRALAVRAGERVLLPGVGTGADLPLLPMQAVAIAVDLSPAMLAQAEAARQAAASQVAYGGTTDGSVIYGNLCSACHTAGVAGAPKLEQAAWSSRIGQGMDTLVKHAIEGFQGQAGIMPARGGNPSLTDEQVAATVQWMVDELK